MALTSTDNAGKMTIIGYRCLPSIKGKGTGVWWPTVKDTLMK
jgi:hypothetical protein